MENLVTKKFKLNNNIDLKNNFKITKKENFHLDKKKYRQLF